MYVNLDARCDYFTYKNDVYYSGTQIMYNGKCNINDYETTSHNQVVTWLYCENGKHYFTHNNIIYTCPTWELKSKIVKIVYNPKEQVNMQTKSQKTEIYWTNDMVTKTLWYIVVMLAATMFYDRIGIWILATIIWFNSTFKKK